MQNNEPIVRLLPELHMDEEHGSNELPQSGVSVESESYMKMGSLDISRQANLSYTDLDNIQI